MAKDKILVRNSQPSPMDSGVFTWDIETDQFFADSAFASLFGLDPSETMVGLPMERYLDRVHPEDKARVAKAVHEAVVSGYPCQQNYRVRSARGFYTEIMAFGRCFRNADGTPSQYAGIVFPVVPVVEESATLQDLCSQAHRAALKSGRLDIARTLRDVLDDLAEEPAPARLQHHPH
ncbi:MULTISPECIES: PAS domain-containing protein [Rhizobium]|uniref:PAS domain-containing protein n=1 Tax=Rhizobium rhododendri TaxID=2506430 RepID=A0ABY8IUV0_9HYPH|nr:MULTISPECIES: PAS domain-containing protein [Rhizobium]MBO9100715.1 PAS domain-containing protein [Rhizobium sp. L58/93]MBO9135924.1 PAS domain-containing protein [Rhizobium sp. B209b/85]MBO9171235.1 PAS domain-containing protein [Rhizobium sp. L245/93]MBO9187102.1 PAS domain-containing protein [Rhizobium sp. E27B/91]MBZ5759553.1 PAS domain-containing protein [Rhizobium sp. VS19-DR96]